VIVKVLQHNFIPLSFSHSVPLTFLFLYESSTVVRIFSFRFGTGVNGCVTFNWLSIFFLGLLNGTSSINCATDGFVKSFKLILTYVGNFQNKVIHFILNQSVKISFRTWLDWVLVAEFVYQKLGKLLTFCLLLVILGLRLSAWLLGVHLWWAVITYLNRCGS